MSHTYVFLDVTRETFEEIRGKLDAPDYQHTFDFTRDGKLYSIDMHGLALREESRNQRRLRKAGRRK